MTDLTAKKMYYSTKIHHHLINFLRLAPTACETVNKTSHYDLNRRFFRDR